MRIARIEVGELSDLRDGAKLVEGHRTIVRAKRRRCHVGAVTHVDDSTRSRPRSVRRYIRGMTPRPLTPPQLGATSQAIRTLAALDDRALAKMPIEDTIPRDESWFSYWLGGRRSARRHEHLAWLREALEPWRHPDGKRSFGMRSNGRITLGRISARRDEVLAVIVLPDGAPPGVRVLLASDYDGFGEAI